MGTRDGLSRVPSAVEWGAMYDEAERQAIASLLLSGIERLPQEQLPPLDVKLQWIGDLQMDEATYKLHVQRATELTRRFRSVGFKSCVLKGVGMAQYYPEPSRRLCGDIDLWVGPNVVKSEKGKVKSGAFRKSLMAWLRTQCEIGYVTWHHVEAKFFDDVEVEVHFFPIWLYNPIRNWRLQRWFKELESAQMVERETGFGYPSVEFNAIYSLVHTFHHLMDEGVGLRHVVDYYYVLRQFFAKQSGKAERKVKSEELKVDTLRVIKSIGLMRFTAAMMYVLKEACGMPSEKLLCEPDVEAGRFLLEEIMMAGNFGQFDERTVRPENETFWHRNLRKFRRQLRFVKYYPGEVFGAPIWKTLHKAWRMVNR